MRCYDTTGVRARQLLFRPLARRDTTPHELHGLFLSLHYVVRYAGTLICCGIKKPNTVCYGTCLGLSLTAHGETSHLRSVHVVRITDLQYHLLIYLSVAPFLRNMCNVLTRRQALMEYSPIHRAHDDLKPSQAKSSILYCSCYRRDRRSPFSAHC